MFWCVLQFFNIQKNLSKNCIKFCVKNDFIFNDDACPGHLNKSTSDEDIEAVMKMNTAYYA